MSAQQKPEESALKYMGIVHDKGSKAFPKLAVANRQDIPFSIFTQGLRDQEFGRMTAIQAKGDESSALRIATSATAFGKFNTTPNDTNLVGVAILRMLQSMITKATL